MNLKKLRVREDIGQAELAEKIGTNAPMVSNFECYKCLPVPKTLNKICKVLNCKVEDIYEAKEIYIKKQPKKGRGIVKSEVDIYKLTVRLPDKARAVFTQDNLEKCGYHSLKDYIWHCYKKLEKQLAIVNSKEKTTTKSNRAVVSREKVI